MQQKCVNRFDDYSQHLFNTLKNSPILNIISKTHISLTFFPDSSQSAMFPFVHFHHRPRHQL